MTIGHDTTAGILTVLSPTAVTVTSFGYAHAGPPAAHAVFDVRHHFSGPHLDPELLELDGTYTRVVEAVMGTPGIPALIDAIAGAARAFLAGPHQGHVAVAVGCAGGRHRSVVIAAKAAAALHDCGIRVAVCNRDICFPPLSRSL